MDDLYTAAVLEAAKLAKEIKEAGESPIIRIAEADPKGGYKLPAEEFEGRGVEWVAMKPYGKIAALVGREGGTGVEKEA